MKTGKLILKIIAILLISISLFYAFLFCTKNEESGIKISSEITVYQNFYTNLTFRNHIQQALNQNEKSLIFLMESSNGGSHGYATGDVITQIVYKMGEQNFLKMVKKLNPEQINEVEGYIEVGLMYGYDDREMEKEFPILYKYFKSN